jgi:hypothetical protein
MNLTQDIRVHLNFVRETKGAVLYEEVDTKSGDKTPHEYTRIGNMYVRKRMFANGKIPSSITVTISFPGEQ